MRYREAVIHAWVSFDSQRARLRVEQKETPYPDGLAALVGQFATQDDTRVHLQLVDVISQLVTAGVIPSESRFPAGAQRRCDIANFAALGRAVDSPVNTATTGGCLPVWKPVVLL